MNYEYDYVIDKEGNIYPLDPYREKINEHGNVIDYGPQFDEEDEDEDPSN